ncbi:asparaginase [Angustibacter sp. Root456]|uniref:asparaginase n=1 Tax=Angustibacter sp. Root456 TaxID=1736539 RepID=UPI0006F55ACD|nr:asparaginase [Angustibacter sp. Root456]KQX66130.1 hypothetical protein ASD06_07010 [Angustibacter sp. Root456]
MRAVTVLATGGTIASRTNAQGSTVASASGAELLERLGRLDVDVTVRDVFRVGSYLMTLERMHELAGQAQRVLTDPAVTGLVVTHGTDTIEETAFFLDLFVGSDRPVVVTGAQRPADAPDTDGPRNLADAIRVAAEPAAQGLGTVVVFDGAVFAAAGVRKVQTLASHAFGAPDHGPLGWVYGDSVSLSRRRGPRRVLPVADFDAARARVDIAACYPGADATALRALAAAGARGIVLEATGAGNANPDICATVEELTAQGVVVATSTRVACGPVASIYGDGGGADLLGAGAVPMGLLRPGQARVLLAALLGVHADPDKARVALHDHLSS